MSLRSPTAEHPYAKHWNRLRQNGLRMRWGSVAGEAHGACPGTAIVVLAAVRCVPDILID